MERKLIKLWSLSCADNVQHREGAFHNRRDGDVWVHSGNEQDEYTQPRSLSSQGIPDPAVIE